MSLTIVHRQGLREFHVTLEPLSGEAPAAMISRLDAQLREHDATVVKQEIFGSLAVQTDVLDCLKNKCGEPARPITWVEGGDCKGRPIAGTHVLAVAGTPAESVVFGDRVVGSVFSDAWSRHCLLGDVRPSNLSDSRPGQAHQVFTHIGEILARAEMAWSDVVRTWLFLDDILSWYGPFNGVRTEFFAQRNVFAKFVPASTGIGARNPAGAAVVAGVWAVQPKRDSLVLEEVVSPLQCEARHYGSSFSRAFELRAPGEQRLLVSGTASIEPGGRSAHPGDVRRQIDLTMDVIEAILTSRQLGFSEVTRATAYFKRAADAPRFAEWCAEHGQIRLPLVTACDDICRDELLFEMEVDAMAASPAEGATREQPLSDKPVKKQTSQR